MQHLLPGTGNRENAGFRSFQNIDKMDKTSPRLILFVNIVKVSGNLKSAFSGVRRAPRWRAIPETEQFMEVLGRG
jgi:hypothetical protein